MLVSSFVNHLTNALLGLHGWQAYLLVGALCFGEIALFIGFILPGEVAVVYGGVLASRHKVDVAGMVALVTACAIFGNFVGYEVGRRLGPTLLRHRPLKDRATVERSRMLLQKRGSTAVFFGRFVAIVRAFAPALAGMSSMRFKGFAIASTTSGAIWAIGYCFAGYAAGVSYAKVLSVAGRASAGLFAGLVLVGIIAFTVNRHLRSSREISETPSSEI